MQRTAVTDTLAPAGIAWLIAQGRAKLSQPDSDVQVWRAQGLEAWQVELLRQQQALRRRSRHRFPCPERWLWTDVSLSQASDHWSATFKAGLFPKGEPVVDACCGAGSDLVALAARGEVLGVDADAGLAALAQDNAVAHGYQAGVRVGYLPAALPPGTRWLSIDPDRRPAGQRTMDVRAFSPSLEQVLDMAHQCAGAVIKLAPSTRNDDDLETRIDTSCQRVWLGNQGECRQLLLLTGELRQRPRFGDHFASGSLRSAVLCEPAPQCESDSATAVSQPTIEIYRAATTPPQQVTPAVLGSFVFDLHPTLHAADLQIGWGSEQGLSPIGSSHGYFTGDSPVDSAWLQAFEVLDVLPWDDRKIRKWLRSVGAGQVEVKSRGLYPLRMQFDANAYQRRYSVASGMPVTLLVTRIGERLRGIAARRLSTPTKIAPNH